MSNEPLYFCKKSCFPIALPEIFVFVGCLLLSALSLYLFIPLIDDSWVAWIFITLVIFSSFFFLYLFTSVILNLLKDKASKCYLYENCFYTQEGLKEKRESAFEIDYYEDVTVEQSLLGKTFNYGDVRIYFRPKTLTVYNCKRPYKLKKFIQDTYLCKEDFTEK